MEQGATSLRERIETRNELKEPEMYKVFIINDDVTDFDFVVFLMKAVFGKTPAEAQDIANSTHNSGKGLIGIYSYDIAQTLVSKATQISRSKGFPLRFTITQSDKG